MSVALLREMFDRMVVAKNAELIEHYYDPDPDKVAGRVWITTSRPGEEPTRIEVVLIAAYRNGRIHRIWETTWPSWRNVAALDDY